MSEPNSTVPSAELPSGDGDLDVGMETVRRRLAVVRRRVHANRFLRALFFDLALALAAFAGYLLVHQLIATPTDPIVVFACIVGGSLAVSLVRGGLLGRASLFRAAVLADEGLSLKERASSAVYLAAHPLTGEASGWAALIERDSAEALRRADVRGAFPIRLPRSALVALAVLVAVPLIPVLIEQQDLLGWKVSREADASMQEEIARGLEEVEKSEEFLELEELAKNDDDPALKAILDAIKQAQDPENAPQGEQGVEQKEGEAAKKEAMQNLSRLEDHLEKRQAKGDYETLKDLLDKMRAQRIRPDDLTRALQKALKDADLAKAGEELDKIKDELAKLQAKKEAGTLSEEDLQRMRKYQRELSSLSRSSNALGKLGRGLEGLESMNLSSEDLAQLMQNLDDMQLDMRSLEQLMKQMQTLEQSLQMLKLAKQGMGKLHKCANCGKLSNCPGGSCNGSGKGDPNGMCSGMSQKQGSSQSQSMSLLGGGGNGTNEAQASGYRGTGTKEATSIKERSKINAIGLDPKGKIVGQLPFDGEAPTGETLLEIEKIITSSQSEARKVERQAIPGEYRDMVREFQESLRTPAAAGGEGTEDVGSEK